jgi:hypothetical protein
LGFLETLVEFEELENPARANQPCTKADQASLEASCHQGTRKEWEVLQKRRLQALNSNQEDCQAVTEMRCHIRTLPKGLVQLERAEARHCQMSEAGWEQDKTAREYQTDLGWQIDLG